MPDQSDTQKIQDDAPFGKYFHYMLNIDDDDLDPYQYRLLGHYRRVCGKTGKCNESLETTCRITQIGEHKIRDTRHWLAANGYISLDQPIGGCIEVRVLDRMASNVMRYADPLQISNGGGGESVTGGGYGSVTQRINIIHWFLKKPIRCSQNSGSRYLNPVSISCVIFFPYACMKARTRRR